MIRFNPTSPKLKSSDGGYRYDSPAPGGASHVRWWYDGSLKLWAVTAHDREDNQIGETSYCARKDQLEPLIDHALKTEPEQ